MAPKSRTPAKALAAKASKSSATCKALGGAPWWVVALAAIVILAIAYLVYITFFKYDVLVMEKPAEPFAEHDGAEVRWKLVLMTMDGCTWCERIRPTFKEMTDKHSDELKGMGVEAVEYEAAQPLAAPLKRHVSGYPTLLLVSAQDESVVHKFDGDRTVAAIVDWVKKHAAGDAFTQQDDDDAVTSNIQDISANASANAKKDASDMQEKAKADAKKDLEKAQEKAPEGFVNARRW